jgi:hypothetical protein
VYYTGTDDDVVGFGMALYNACDTGALNQAFFCGNSPANDEAVTACVSPNQTIYIRVWSADGTAANWQAGWGKFRIAVFATPSTDVVLWTEDFSNGLTGWTTFGTCGGNPDSNANAVWRYFPDGIIDRGAYANVGVGVTGSLTPCNGGVGVDCDYDDNRGVPNAFGTGPCPTGDGSQYILESPVLYHANWGVAGVSIKWIQGIREFQSDFFVGYRIFENNVWSDWVSFQVNTDDEYNGAQGDPRNAHFIGDRRQVFLGGAQKGDSLQIRFVYNANYYYWGIDDVSLIEAPCVDMRSQSNFYAIAPAAQTPWSQFNPWFPLNDIYNGGACDQTNVNLNLTIVNSDSIVVYDENLAYGTIAPDSLAENANFTTPVDLSSIKSADMYTGTYTVTSDDAVEGTDFDFSNNTNSFSFFVTPNTFALESGATRSLAPATTEFDMDANFGYVYGAYYYFPNGEGVKVKSVTWGANNPMDVAGVPINLILFKWVDVNQDEVVQPAEREIIGFGEEVFDGTTPANIILETPLDNFNNPGADVILEDNTAYLMVMQYAAVARTNFFISASGEYDYSAIQLSASQAGAPTYSAVLGLPSDGNVNGIEYTVVQTFGARNDIVPVMQLNLDKGVAVKDILPADNIVKVYPNPVSERLYMDIEFAQKMDKVLVQMLDASGKSVFAQNYSQMDRAKLEFDVTGLIPGAYMMHVGTENGIRTVPFVVQK